MSDIGELSTYQTARGEYRYEIEVIHNKLHKHQLFKASDPDIVELKARLKAAEWDEMWEKKEKLRNESEQKRHEIEQKRLEKETGKLTAEERTMEAQAILNSIEQILSHTLNINDAIDWESLKNKKDYFKPKPVEPKTPPPPHSLDVGEKPKRADKKYTLKYGILDFISKKRKLRREQDAEARFFADHKSWEESARREYDRHKADVMEHQLDIERIKRNYTNACKEWEKDRLFYLQQRDQVNTAVDNKKQEYLNGSPSAIYDYCDMVLSNSDYPDFFPKTYDLDYNPDNKILIVDYQLPTVSAIPTLKEVKYILSRNEFTEKFLTEIQINKIYDLTLYQIALRTIHELYEADVIGTLESIVFNGIVSSVDPSTGQDVTACVLSVQTNKEEFLKINLAQVDSKACFKKLKGVGSSKLHSLTPVAPIIQIEKDDKRFVKSYDVVDGIDQGSNLAAMDWEDFEHLIREIFEKEFSAGGGEVKVTRASKDGGVDAVVFDPDPIRGGKIVIQAKRYTNTVGVSAVRDLYGTLLNEGANKGILVSTADYGPDAYEFARGKPLTLLNGSNLLHLLQKHGHKACIDLKDAKRILAEQNQ